MYYILNCQWLESKRSDAVVTYLVETKELDVLYNPSKIETRIKIVHMQSGQVIVGIIVFEPETLVFSRA